MPKLLFLVVIVIIASSIGCKEQIARQNQVYAGKAVDMTNELQGAGERWGKAIGPWIEGGTLDTELADRETQALKDFISQLKKKFAKLPVPDNQECKRFASTVEDYLDFEAEMALTFDEMVQTAADNNPASFEFREQWLTQLMGLNDEELAWKSKLKNSANTLGLRIVDATEAK